MVHKHSHFPTLDRVARTTAARWLDQAVRNERGLLRLALYVMLFVSVSHVVATRTFAYQGGNLQRTPWGVIVQSPISAFQNLEPGGFLSLILAVTFTVLGPGCSELAPAIVVVCLAGLAASTQPDAARERRAYPPDERAVVTAGPLEPEPPRPPPPPPRHPLDLDPTDSPLEPRWPKRSPPSR